MIRVLLACLLASSALADVAPSVSRIAVKQRWPWSAKVDIDYWLDSDRPVDVSFTATWDGQSEPFALDGAALSGCTYSARPGMNHAEWDPVAAGVSTSTPLKNFAVTPTIESSGSRKYLVINLKNGDCTFYADEPTGGWNQDSYKKQYMVFRRIPAGVYTLGYTTEQMDRLSAIGATGKSDYSALFAQRTVRITSDYYIALFQVTSDQNTRLGGSGSSNSTIPWAMNPSLWRGSLTDPAAKVNWPTEGFNVSADSTVGRLRSRVAGKLPPQMVIDLPTEAQWEVAARTGSTTFYSGFGTLENTKQEILDFQIAHSTNRTVSVGLMQPNDWGLYDTSGIAYEMTLNLARGDASKNYIDTGSCKVDGQDVDPVGMTVDAGAENLFAVTCNCGWGSRAIAYTAMPPARRLMRAAGDVTSGARLCIHLNPPLK